MVRRTAVVFGAFLLAATICVFGIVVGIQSQTNPRPAATQAVITPQEKEYLSFSLFTLEYLAENSAYLESLEAARQQNPLLAQDPAWQAEVASVALTLKGTSRAIQTYDLDLSISERYQRLHDQMVSNTQHYEDAVDLYLTATIENDETMHEKAITVLHEGNTAMADYAQTMANRFPDLIAH